MKKAHKFQLIRNSDKMKQNISQTTDSGRSMVEMLGVLAVIGVLSVTGILGYRYAMDKYKANQFVNDVNLRTHTLIEQILADKPINLEEWGENSMSGYAFSDYGVYEDGSVSIIISHLPKRICQLSVESLKNRYELTINNQPVGENNQCNQLENDLEIFVEGEIKADCFGENCLVNGMPHNILPTQCSNCYGDSECVVCTNNKCDYKAKNNQSCYNEQYICLFGSCGPACTSNKDCASDEYCGTSGATRTQENIACRKLDMKAVTLNENGKMKKVFLSNYPIPYYDIYNICSRLNRRPIKDSDLFKGWDFNADNGMYVATDFEKKLYEKAGGIRMWTVPPSLWESVPTVQLSGEEKVSVQRGYVRLQTLLIGGCL